MKQVFSFLYKVPFTISCWSAWN